MRREERRGEQRGEKRRGGEERGEERREGRREEERGEKRREVRREGRRGDKACGEERLEPKHLLTKMAILVPFVLSSLLFSPLLSSFPIFCFIFLCSSVFILNLTLALYGNPSVIHMSYIECENCYCIFEQDRISK